MIAKIKIIRLQKVTNPANERPRVTTVVPAYTRNTGLVVTDKEATMYQASMVYSSVPSKSATTINDYKDDIIFDEQIYLSYNLDVKNAIDKKHVPSGKFHYENLSEGEKKTRIYKSNLADIYKCYELIENEPKKHNCQIISTFMDWNNTPRRDINKIGIKPTIFFNV